MVKGHTVHMSNGSGGTLCGTKPRRTYFGAAWVPGRIECVTCPKCERLYFANRKAQAESNAAKDEEKA